MAKTLDCAALHPGYGLIRERIQKRFLSCPKCTLAALYRDIAQACRSQGLPVPARNTVESRVATLDPPRGCPKARRSRYGSPAAIGGRLCP